MWNLFLYNQAVLDTLHEKKKKKEIDFKYNYPRLKNSIQLDYSIT